MAEGGSARERVPREQQCEPERHEQDLRAEVDQRDDHRPAVQSRPVQQPDRSDRGDDAAPRDDVPRPMDLREERTRDVMRHEQCRERDHDQVVEEERPAGHEPGEVVVRDAYECRGAAGLADGRGALRVRQCDDEEEPADDEKDERRQAERVERDDPEREIDRRGDLAVRDREQNRRVEDALEPRQLPGHDLSLRPAGRRAVRLARARVNRFPPTRPLPP